LASMPTEIVWMVKIGCPNILDWVAV
jgi:hypothetical protein